jgi:hypothetical protein
LTIDGESHAITLSGDVNGDDDENAFSDNVRVFLVNAGVTATLKNLTIIKGVGGNWTDPILHGGGIYNQGTLTVTGNTLSNNWGGIRNEVGATLAVSGSNFYDNWVSSWGGDATYKTGGAILNHGVMTITGSAFSGNHADGIAAIGAVSNSGTATITASTFYSNTSLFMGGGAMGNFGTMTIASSLFTENSGGVSSLGGGGGAILNKVDAGGRLTNRDRLLEQYAGWAAEDGTEYSSLGGAILSQQGALSVAASTFQGNTAPFVSGGSDTYGGAIVAVGSDTGVVSITNNTFLENSALLGGALAAGGTNVALTNNTFVSNTATTSGTLWLNGSGTLSNNLLGQGTTGGNCEIEAGSVFTATSNLADDDTCGAGFINSATINLGTPGNYGGNTETIPLLPGSAAIDTGDSGACPATDQRGMTRPQGAGCDIGAFEVAVPEMTVLGNGQVITNNDATPAPADHTDFGGAAVNGGQIIRTFTISNSGNLTLTLTGSPLVSVTGPAAGDFSVTAQPGATVGPSLTTPFTVRFAPTVIGTRAATVTIANNDPDENPYTFAVQGVGDICFATLDGVTVYASANAQAVRDAVSAASPGDTVKVAGYCAGVQAQLATTQTVMITQPLTLAGGYTPTNWSTYDPTGNPTPLDALGGGRVIYADAAVTVQGLTVTNGYINATSDLNGGGIFASGALTLTDMVVYSTTLTGTAYTKQYGAGCM